MSHQIARPHQFSAAVEVQLAQVGRPLGALPDRLRRGAELQVTLIIRHDRHFPNVLGYHLHPRSEIASEPQRGVSGDPAFAMDDLVDSARWYADRHRLAVSRDPK